MRAGAREDGELKHASLALGLALTSTFSILAACSRTEPPPRTVVGPSAAFEVAEVVSAETAGAQTFPSYDASKPDVHLIDVTRYELESAKATLMEYGLMSQIAAGQAGEKVPTIGFHLVEKDRDAFHAWTAARVGRTMATLMDRKVVSVSTVSSALPGVGMCDFRAPGTTLGELEALAARLVTPK